MRLLVGLGNPGENYAASRHNIGFYALDTLAASLDFSGWKRFKGGELLKAKEWALFKPLEFMNRSGQPLEEVMSYFQITPDNLCVIADDVYIAPGSVRIRHTGGDGGHKGWKSVLEKLPATDFWRVRVGVGLYEQEPLKRQHQPPLDEYVLRPMPLSDRKKVEKVIDNLLPDLINWLGSGTMGEKTVHAI